MGQAKTEPALSVAERAIGTDQDRRFVMVVGDDNKVAYRQVQLGTAENGLRMVTSGLKPGERIVVDGILKVQPGAVVKGVPLAAEAAPNATPAPPGGATGKDEKAPS